MTVTIVQTATAAPAAANLTFEATFAAGCTAGNAIVWVIGGDKNSGTITPPTDCPNFPIDLRTANGDGHVTLAMAYGTADGGETLISGSVSANVAGGQVWLAELNDDTNTGAWARFGTSTHLTDFSNITALTVGPVTPTQNGLAIAAVAADSVNTQGTVTWSNSYTARRATASGGGQAGLWTAEKAVTVGGGATSTQIIRSGGSSDQHSGFLTVFAQTAVTGTTGALAGQAPRATGALTGQHIDTGALAGTAPQAVGALAGVHRASGALAGSAPQAVGALAGVHRASGAFAGVAPQATGALAGVVRASGALGGTAPQVVASLSGVVRTTGALAGSVAPAVGVLAGVVRTTGALAGSAPRAVGVLEGFVDTGETSTTGVLAGQAPRATGQLVGVHRVDGGLAGTAPRATGSLTDYVVPAFVRPLLAGTVGVAIGGGLAAGTGALVDTGGPRAGTATVEG